MPTVHTTYGQKQLSSAHFSPIIKSNPNPAIVPRDPYNNSSEVPLWSGPMIWLHLLVLSSSFIHLWSHKPLCYSQNQADTFLSLKAFAWVSFRFTDIWISPSPPSSLCLNVTSSMRPILIPLFITAPDSSPHHYTPDPLILLDIFLHHRTHYLLIYNVFVIY